MLTSILSFLAPWTGPLLSGLGWARKHWKAIALATATLGALGYMGYLHLQIHWKEAERDRALARAATADAAIDQWRAEVDRLNGINQGNLRALGELQQQLAENRRIAAAQAARQKSRDKAIAHSKQEVADVPPSEIKPVSPVLFRTLQQLRCVRRTGGADQGAAAGACGDPYRAVAP